MDTDVLSGVSAVLAVVAHPDDESFGLGGILDRLIRSGVPARVLCFTHGEASTLYGPHAGDLHALRAAELDCAAAALGVEEVHLLDYRDGALAGVPPAELAGHVGTLIEEFGPSHLLVFDDNGVTGHPDHVSATRAAVAAAAVAGLPVLAWTIPEEIAELLNEQFGTRFAGQPAPQVGTAVTVARCRQARAIDCHRSQALDNPVLRLRLALVGDADHVRRLC